MENTVDLILIYRDSKIMKKYDTTMLFLLAVLVLSIPTGFAFASEDNGDDRYDDDDRDDDRYDDDSKDDDRYDDDDRDDDRYDDDSKDDDRSGDSSKTSGFSEREVRSENLGFQTEISIEIEFVSNTTDTNQLIDEIINRFSLTREEADKELRTERSDDRRLEEKFEVEIEKRGNTSKVEVELETVIDSTSRGEILDAIVKNSQLTREQINEQLRFDSDDKDDDSNDDDTYQNRDDYREEREEYREERKEYREFKVCTNEGECVEDEEFKKTREAYRQEREEYRSDKQLGSETKQQAKKYAKMLEILGNAKFGDNFVLPPRIQMLLVEDYNEIECRSGLELIFKTSNDIPMCVKDTTATKLLEKGIAYK